MWLNEQESKILLEESGIVVPAGWETDSLQEALRRASETRFPVYVKALGPEKDRLHKGAVLRVADASELANAFSRVTEALDVAAARVEEEIPSHQWWYLSIGRFPPSGNRTLMLSREGGSGIERRKEAVATIEVDPLLPTILPYHVRTLLYTLGIKQPLEIQDGLVHVFRACDALMRGRDALLIELNPIAETGDGFVAVGARILIDPHALYRQERIHRFFSRRTRRRSIQDDLNEMGMDYVPLGGRIGVVSLGAGLTMHIADWIDEEGGSAGFFLDATRAAIRDWKAIFEERAPVEFSRALRYGFDRVLSNVDVLLVNVTAGGTPVDAVAAGVVMALDRDWQERTVFHLAGSRSAQAREAVRKLDLRIADSLKDAIAMAIELERVS